MTAKRKSITLAKPEIESQQEFRDTVKAVARDMIIARQVRANMDQELASVRARYEVELIPLDNTIEANTDLCATFCVTRNDLFANGAKSVDLVTAVIGFRTGQPKVKILKRWNLAAVIAAIKARKWADKFIRETEELNKERIIAERADLGEALKAVGLDVVQDERFYIEPKDLDAQPTQSVTEAP